MRIPGTGRLRSRWDTLQGSYGFVPAQMAGAAAVVAQALIWIDRRAPEEWVSALPWLYEPSAEGARAVLAALAGGR